MFHDPVQSQRIFLCKMSQPGSADVVKESTVLGITLPVRTVRPILPKQAYIQYVPYRTVIYRGEQPSVCAQYEYSTVMQAFRFSFSFSDLGWAWRRKRVPRCTRNEPWRQRYGKRNLLVNRKDINISGIENKD
jgi:hypothetical protein